MTGKSKENGDLWLIKESDYTTNDPKKLQINLQKLL
jgi:hypothetical protein